MLKMALFCSASMAALCAGDGAFAADKPVPLLARSVGEVRSIISAPPGNVVLYDQNDDLNKNAVVSMNFTDGSFTSFSSYGADDFVIPAGHKWKIKQVEVTGTYWNQGPATSENVLFYRDNGGLPGTLVAECDNIKGQDVQGSFAIRIPRTCHVRLKGGRTYWLSVVANVDYLCCGEWRWETRNSENGYPATWENPDNGFGTGCKTWEVIQSCLGNFGQGPDFMFALKGKDIAPRESLE